MKKIKNKEANHFFLKLSEQMNYISRDNVKEFYYGFVRATVKELVDNGSVMLPGFGKMSIIKYPGKRMKNVNGEGYWFCPETVKIKFKVNAILNKYVKAKKRDKLS